MDNSKKIFIDAGFEFGKDLLPIKFDFEDSYALNEKLRDYIFIYNSSLQTNTSFYFINKLLSKDELIQVRKYIWNENKVSLLFYLSSDANDLIELKLQYAKASPTIANENCELDTFTISEIEEQHLDKIQRWKFDSGVFWTNYQDFFAKSKSFKSIDKELIETLTSLKNSLNNVIDVKESEEYVQALIDRTLYIKYLEDNHIINSDFYQHHFEDNNLNYKELLSTADSKKLNKLFELIHNIFSNKLFEKPSIPEKCLTSTVCNLIRESLNHNVDNKQLSLFDFRFDIIPIEFISYIYEIFLTAKQKESGIYYTPKKLAHLIVDDVITDSQIGSVLDPSCGSGMFLIISYQKLLEIAQKKGLEPSDSIEKIRFRLKLLSENIFGIEKELTAQRFTLFSLSLQIFKGINPYDIKEFIAKELKQNKRITLFSEHSFFDNIKHENTLNLDESSPFKNKKFSYIVGNPPFLEIKDVKEYETEIKFLKSYQVEVDEEQKFAKDIVGRSQISQCFFLKIKDWANSDTKFGFVSNSSNFDNEYSEKFQDYFYTHYKIEKIYELSKVKKILFEKAKESVMALIFSSSRNENEKIKYYSVEMTLFSKKPFELLIIQEDKAITINQRELINRDVELRDFFISNYQDIALVKNITTSKTLKDIMSKDSRYSSIKGLDRLTNESLKQHFGINRKLSSQEIRDLHERYANEHYLSANKTSYYNNPFLHKPAHNILPFSIKSVDGYVNKKDIQKRHFQRIRDLYIYEEGKILINKFGNRINAAFVNETLFFSNLIYSIKLQDAEDYLLVTAILNSDLINYFINQKYQRRHNSNFTNIPIISIKNIPIPKELDQNVVEHISAISKDLTDGKYEYTGEVKENLNELIFDLYDLSFSEKQRVKDYFLVEKKMTKSKNEIETYITTLEKSLNVFLKTPANIHCEHQATLGLLTVKVDLNPLSKTPSAKKSSLFLLNEIFKQNPQENFLASREKIWGKDCVYIMKEDKNTNWTKTKAYEDRQEILNRLIG